MTAQLNDMFRYHEKEFAIAGISSGELFDPHTFGMEPFGTCSACWRGYLAVFALSDSHLVLDDLYVNLITDEETFGQVNGPVINGISAVQPPEDYDIFNNDYQGLKYPLGYTGGLLLAHGFIHELYVHMGFHQAWKYERVFELIFDGGLLKQEFDRSEKIEEIRRKFINSEDHYKEGRVPASMEELSRFINDAFDRSYDI